MATIAKIKNHFFIADQSKEGRIKISVALFLIATLITSGTIAAYGAINFHQSGLEPLKFIGSVLSKDTLPFGMAFGTLGFLSLIYIYKTPKPSHFKTVSSPPVDSLQNSIPTLNPYRSRASQLTASPALPSSSSSLSSSSSSSSSSSPIIEESLPPPILPFEFQPIPDSQKIYPIKPPVDDDFAQEIDPPKALIAAGSGSQLVGCNSRDYLRRLQFQLLRSGTPGVNIKGTDANDFAFVQRRIEMVHKYIGPYAHTRDSLRDFEKLREPLGFFPGSDGNGYLLEEILKLHTTNEALMVEVFGKQLRVQIIGGGPIGLAAALMWYQLGAQVFLYERYAEVTTEGEEEKKESGSKVNRSERERRYDERSQPFSLQTTSFNYLAALGLTKKTILNAFGLSDEMWNAGIIKAGNAQAAAYAFLSSPLMREARAKLIGSHVENYLPNQVSLPIGVMQHLLLGVIKKVKTSHPSQINLFFNHRCTGLRTDGSRRKELQFNDSLFMPACDVIYNASGGNINHLLGAKTSSIAKMHGLGVFYPKPPHPIEKSPIPKPILSRAVRLFTTYNSNWVYANIEISRRSYLNADPQEVHNIIDIFAHQTGLTTTRNFFKVEVDLARVEKVVEHNAAPTFRDGLQIVIHGGDAAIKPDFRTASGANNGLQGQALQMLSFSDVLRKQIDLPLMLRQFENTHDLLSRQIAQIVVDLFGRRVSFDS